MGSDVEVGLHSLGFQGTRLDSKGVDSQGVDRPRVERAVREFLLAVGEDPDRPGLAETPARVARAAVEMYGGLHEDPASILNKTFDLGHEELVLVKDIPFYSTCEHHLVPFHGVAHVGYIPSAEGLVTRRYSAGRLKAVPSSKAICRLRLSFDSLISVGQRSDAMISPFSRLQLTLPA